MKLFSLTVTLLPSLASAFCQPHVQISRMSLNAGSPAKSFEEDLELTKKVINDYNNDGDAPAAEETTESDGKDE